MDVHVPRVVTVQLRLAGIAVVTAQEDGHADVDDPVLMDRAAELGRLLVSQDKDLLVEATRRQRSSTRFDGLVHYRPLEISIGHLVSDLRLIAEASDSSEWLNRVEYLPL
jgi:predicted nuclease of predicted toxin-antitoxin system